MEKVRSNNLTTLIHHEDDIMQYFRALLEEGDKDTLKSYFKGVSQTAPKW